MSKSALENDRLLLRLPTARDINSIYKVVSDSKVLRFVLLPTPYRREHAVTFVERAREQHRKGSGLHLAICRKPDLTIMGVIGIQSSRAVDRNCELGYWLGSAYWNRGYMTESVQLILTHVFRSRHMNRVWARTQPANAASNRILRRAGFVIEGRLRQHRKIHGRWHDELEWGLLRREYTAAKR